VRRLILCILAATVFVVVFDEVFKNGREEIEFLIEDFLETKIHQLVDDGFAEIIPLAAVGNVIAQFIEQSNLSTRAGFNGEYFVVENGNIPQGIVKEFGKFFFILPVIQVGEVMFPFQFGTIGVHSQQQHFILLVCIGGYFLFPTFSLCQFGFQLFYFITEFVVHELIQEHLGNDLKFIAIVS